MPTMLIQMRKIQEPKSIDIKIPVQSATVDGLSAFVDILDDVSCSGNEPAEAIINISGGSGQYLVLIEENPPISEISPGIFSTTVTGGTYGITITDLDDDCQFIDNFAVGQPSPIEIDAEITEIDSCSGRILMVDFSVTGGTPPYDSEVIPDNLGVEILVTDNEGCMESLYIPNPELEDALTISEIVVFHPDPGDDNGSIDITVTGGEEPYFYLWEDADGNELSTDEDIDDLEAGVYVVYVSDANSCNILSGDIVLDMTSSTTETVEKQYKIFPNPSEGSYIFLDGPHNQSCSIKVLDAEGKFVYQQRRNNSIERLDVTDLQSGI